MNRQIAATVIAGGILFNELMYMLGDEHFNFNNTVVHTLALIGLATCGLLFRRRNPS
jgi:aspartokinase-like uncharacterized kinase